MVKKIVLVPQPLTPEEFRPFGRVLVNKGSYVPRLTVGQVMVSRMRGYQRKELDWFSAHDDGEQVIVPLDKVPTIFVVGHPSREPNPAALKAFLSQGQETIVLSPSVWHTIPVPVTVFSALYENHHGSEWTEHTRSVNLPKEKGVTVVLHWEEWMKPVMDGT
ncbi:MAG: ureidoglycolate lyase [Armatimonadetes bacterium]|nr:ureidoglycolate lyase [Armatimonadota bacterium]MDW8121290.1 ureidoglycolate lyase [Armatimonadota bacterium]